MAVSALAFAWVVVQAQGGCGTEPAPAVPEAAAAQEAEPAPGTAASPPAAPIPESPPAVPVSETPKAKPANAPAKEKPAVYFSPSKSGDFDFDDVNSGAGGIGGIGEPNAGRGDKSNNAGNKNAKPKAFFPASKSGRVPEPTQQHPNAPATK